MKKVAVKQFKSFGLCWPENTAGRERFREIAKIRNEWTALDVLELPDFGTDDKLCAVLCSEFLPDEILHEFACRCAEYALSFIEKPAPRSVAAIEAKRAWLRGEISDDELAKARRTAWDAAWYSAWSVLDAAEKNARDVAKTAWTAAEPAAWAAARDTAWEAAWYTVRAARTTADDSEWRAAWEAVRDHELEMLVDLIKEHEDED